MPNPVPSCVGVALPRPVPFWARLCRIARCCGGRWWSGPVGRHHAQKSKYNPAESATIRDRAPVTVPISGPACRRKALSSWFWMPRRSQNWAERRSLWTSPSGHTASSPTREEWQHVLSGVGPKGGFHCTCGSLKGNKARKKTPPKNKHNKEISKIKLRKIYFFFFPP